MLELTRSITDSQQTPDAVSFSVSCAQSPTPGIDAEVFVLHRQADGNDYFSCIASLPQMSALPAGAPASLQEPFFRVDSIVIDSESATHAEELWEDIQQHVQELVHNYRASLVLTPEETVTIS